MPFIASSRRVDEVSTHRHYHSLMRRLWLTILMAFALTLGGYANALAAQACPMEAPREAAAVASHDCCPDDETSQGGAPTEQSQKGMAGCVMGQACRTAPALTPSLAPIRLSSVTIPVSQPIVVNPAPARAPLSKHWRPPRLV